MTDKDFEFTNAMLETLKREREKLQYSLRQIDIQIESLEDFKNKLKSDNKQLDLVEDTILKGNKND